MFGAIPGLCWVILYWLVSAVSVCGASVDTIVELAIRFPVVVKCRRVTMPLNVNGLHFETISQATGTNFWYNKEAKRRRRKNGKQIGTAGPLFGTSKFDGAWRFIRYRDDNTSCRIAQTRHAGPLANCWQPKMKKFEEEEARRINRYILCVRWIYEMEYTRLQSTPPRVLKVNIFLNFLLFFIPWLFASWNRSNTLQTDTINGKWKK